MIGLVSFSQELVGEAETFINVRNIKISFAHFWNFRENNRSSLSFFSSFYSLLSPTLVLCPALQS